MSTYEKAFKAIPSAATLKKGTLTGAILLICGSSIGVGILPLPILTGQAGALPTLTIFFACWLFMSTTALLLSESCAAYSGNHNFISLSRLTLNKIGQYSVLFSFLFLFYSLTTAYIAKGGELTHAILSQCLPFQISAWVGPVTLTVVSALIVFKGAFIIDHINRIFMIGFFATYCFLTFSGIDHFDVKNVSYSDWSFSIFIIPFIITSFGYHNMVPSINEYLGYDRRKLYLSIFLSGIALFLIYNFWVIGLQGIIPLHGEVSITSSFAKGEIVTQPLAAIIHSPLVFFSAMYMAFFAIITSILGQGLSIIDFLADKFQIEKTAKVRLYLCLLLFVPTFICSQIIPGVFFKALELAGGIAAMVIFGIIPALMSWVNRYRRPELANRFKPLVPGGKVLLVTIIALASCMIAYELVKNLILP